MQTQRSKENDGLSKSMSFTVCHGDSCIKLCILVKLNTRKGLDAMMEKTVSLTNLNMASGVPGLTVTAELSRHGRMLTEVFLEVAGITSFDLAAAACQTWVLCT